MINRRMKTGFVFHLLLLLLPLVVLVTSSRRTADDVTLHIIPQHQGAALPDGFYIYQRLNEHGIGIKSITPEDDSIIVRLSSPEQSRAASEVLKSALPQASVIARQPDAIPIWRQKLSQQPFKLG
ncbi:MULTISPECIES: EnvZ/OmpR regulon moderator MzrA [Musicola]|uniref:Modulator protein MzrA n=1 Tax=Musicola paradisiaca (strain Ech703) TaxID=579405 RepID=MZRA_MUSP7|nr:MULTISPECIES: EnvZ/OmpR regulon moderator MzrA [Musicola]C6CE57.1 RecName: Full=Modulator protein MzrA [Musicola paradisiaca Ech703]ACS87151.1 conserved hypothetical protein [Musicola paradisiaca Ech703]